MWCGFRSAVTPVGGAGSCGRGTPELSHVPRHAAAAGRAARMKHAKPRRRASLCLADLRRLLMARHPGGQPSSTPARSGRRPCSALWQWIGLRGLEARGVSRWNADGCRWSDAYSLSLRFGLPSSGGFYQRARYARSGRRPRRVPRRTTVRDRRYSVGSHRVRPHAAAAGRAACRAPTRQFDASANCREPPRSGGHGPQEGGRPPAAVRRSGALPRAAAERRPRPPGGRPPGRLVAPWLRPRRPKPAGAMDGPAGAQSRNPESSSLRAGACSLRTALASICRIRSRVTLKMCPTSSSV